MEWEDRKETISMWKKVGIRKIKSMKAWKKKMSKYQENWIFGKYKIGKY